MNEKALAELSIKDRTLLEELLAKESQALTQAERAHLVSRRAYLNKEALERYEIDGPEESTEGEEEGGDTDYETMTVKDLQAMCADRGIEVDAKAKKADLIATLEADDRGELEEEEE